ncbi:hypothetical protein [Actinomadura monticuli]|uniref:Transposase n=1 Tax=Actinomadura monticuli TaxID=3097367 RepID=A0ABV4Q5N2_9ACTN
MDVAGTDQRNGRTRDTRKEPENLEGRRAAVGLRPMADYDAEMRRRLAG